MFARYLQPTIAVKALTKWHITVVSVQNIAPITVLIKYAVLTGPIIPVQIVSLITSEELFLMQRQRLNEDLPGWYLNPDVTVRSRGVMEKCSFCVQRLQEGKLNAKKEDRPLKDGEVQTACMQACPTNAIIFGNVNDKDSKVSKMRDREQKERKFYVLEQLHVLSNVNYLVKVRNTDRSVGNLTVEEG